MKQYTLQGQAQGRQRLQVTARHPARSKSSHGSKSVQKKRDIRTSFLRTPITSDPQDAAQQSVPVAIPAVTPPPVVATPAAAAAADSAPPAVQISPPVIISLGDQSCSTERSNSSRVSGEPVIASLALVAEAPSAASPAASAEVDLLNFSSLSTLSVEESGSSSSSSSVGSVDVVDPVWGTADRLSSLAALDRALDGLILAPTNPPPGKSITSSKLSSSSRKTAKKSSRKAELTSVPAFTSIYSETDWEREVAAAAANEQLLVVKVEAAQSPMHSNSALDSAMRFQTSSSFPPSLNTFLSPTDAHPSFSPLGSFNSSSGTATVAFTASHEAFPAMVPGPLAYLNASSSAGSQMCQLDSPVHQWYKELAAQYQASSCSSGKKAGSVSPLRFLSLQSDGPRAKALCRKLGVFDAVLSALIYDPSSGKKVLEVCGTKVEQELPAGLLYYGDMDTLGMAPSRLLPRISSKAELESHRSSADVTVVAFQMKAAPTMHKTYKHLYEAAQTFSGIVPFAAMKIDCNEECSAVSSELGLERLPAYVVYKGGEEVHRLSRTSSRRKVAEVLKYVVAGNDEAAAVAALPATTA